MKFHARRFSVFLLVFTLALAWMPSIPAAQAQGDGTLPPNEPQIVSLSAGQSLTRTFTAQAGDSFDLKLTRLSDYPYSAVLVGPDASATPLVPGPDGNVVYPVESAPQAGTFTLIVQAAGSGEMLIELSTLVSEPLTFGLTVVEMSDSARRYLLSAPPDLTDATELIIDTLPYDPAAPLNLPPVSLVNQDTGDTVVEALSARLPAVSAILLPGQTYVLTLLAGDQPMQVNVTWNPVPGLIVTPEPGQVPAVPDSSSSSSSSSSSGACQLVFNGPVNVRSGPGTTYGVIGGVGAGTTLPVTGRNANASWWQVSYNGQAGWVSAGLYQIEAQGDCGSVPVASASGTGTPQYTYTPTPTLQYTYTPSPTLQYTYTPSYTPTPPLYTYTPSYTPPADSIAPTYTYTPTYTPTNPAPTATYTPSYTPTTPPAAQVAPPDSNYAFNMALDTTSSISDFVSYPGGDTEDRVSYGVTGMNPNVAFSGGRARLILAVSCFGTGLENVQFFTNGSTYGCGQTVLDREVTFDSNTGAVTITAVGGDATYVQWVLTGTVTRLN